MRGGDDAHVDCRPLSRADRTHFASCSTRKSLACNARGMSPISPKTASSVGGGMALVIVARTGKRAFAVPNIRFEQIFRDGRALTATKDLRAAARSVYRAGESSFPVPLAPWMNTLASGLGDQVPDGARFPFSALRHDSRAASLLALTLSDSGKAQRCSPRRARPNGFAATRPRVGSVDRSTEHLLASGTGAAPFGVGQSEGEETGARLVSRAENGKRAPSGTPVASRRRACSSRARAARKGAPRPRDTPSGPLAGPFVASIARHPGKSARIGIVRTAKARYRCELRSQRVIPAATGTLFLDEIGRHASCVASKLLRVLQDAKCVPGRRDSGTAVDVRIISARIATWTPR